MGFSSINYHLLPIKIHYFAFFAGVGPVVLFMPTYAKQLGFSSILVGTAYTVLPVVGMLSKPIMGAVADRFHCHKQLVITLVAITATSWFCIQFIPHVSGNLKGELDCTTTSPSYLRVCSEEDKPDKCMKQKVHDEHHKDHIIKCKMECVSGVGFLDDICSWEFTKYCNKSAKIKRIANSEYSTYIPPPNTSDFVVIGSLYGAAVEQRDKCLLLPLKKVEDVCVEGEFFNNPTCSINRTANCKLSCDSPALAKAGVVREEQITYTDIQFWLFILLMVAGWVGLASVTNLGDTVCFGLIGDCTVSYGNQRMWGSVGWGLTSIVSGLLMDAFSEGEMDKNYKPLFYMTVFFLTIQILAISRIEETKRVHSPSFLRDIGKLFLDIRIVVFILWCILAGVFNGMIGNFLFWHLETIASCRDQEWIKTLEGLYIFIQGFFGEIPFFFINGYIMKKIGHINCMSLVLLAFAMKFFFYGIIDNPWYVLPVGLLNGITFSTFYATMASHASSVAAPGTEATVQGLVSALYEGVGVSIGSFVAGALLDKYEGHVVFKFYAVVALFFCGVHIVVQYFLNRNVHVDVSPTENKKDPGQSDARYASPNFAITRTLDQDDSAI